MIEACAFCGETARHFVEGQSVTKGVYLCDVHVELVPTSLREGEADEDLSLATGDNTFELGMYSPGPDGCTCDTWR